MNEQKIEQFWRDAKHGDVARVMNREAVEARFRDRIDQEWKPGLLSGWSKIDKSDSLQWVSSEGASWRYCQVYDPPQWYTDKPDPGEGYRILHPDERVEKGDEYYSPANNMWLLSGSPDTCDCKQANFPYRRRIEPVNSPEKLDSCERQKLEAGKEYFLPSGMVLVVNSESVEVKND